MATKNNSKTDVLSTILQFWSKTQQEKDVEARELKLKSLQANAEALVTEYKENVFNAKSALTDAIAKAEKQAKPSYKEIFDARLKVQNAQYLLAELLESYKEHFGTEPKI